MTHTTVPVILDLHGTPVDPRRGIADGTAAARREPGRAARARDLARALANAPHTPNEVYTHGDV